MSCPYFPYKIEEFFLDKKFSVIYMWSKKIECKKCKRGNAGFPFRAKVLGSRRKARKQNYATCSNGLKTFWREKLNWKNRQIQQKQHQKETKTRRSRKRNFDHRLDFRNYYKLKRETRVNTTCKEYHNSWSREKGVVSELSHNRLVKHIYSRRVKIR